MTSLVKAIGVHYEGKQSVRFYYLRNVAKWSVISQWTALGVCDTVVCQEKILVVLRQSREAL